MNFGRLVASRVLAAFIDEYGVTSAVGGGTALGTFKAFTARLAAVMRDAQRAALRGVARPLSTYLLSAVFVAQDGTTESFTPAALAMAPSAIEATSTSLGGSAATDMSAGGEHEVDEVAAMTCTKALVSASNDLLSLVDDVTSEIDLGIDSAARGASRLHQLHVTGGSLLLHVRDRSDRSSLQENSGFVEHLAVFDAVCECALRIRRSAPGIGATLLGPLHAHDLGTSELEGLTGVRQGTL